MCSLENFAQKGKKIIGIAANYHELIKILKIPIPEKPGVFLKPPTSYIVEGETIRLPKEFEVNEEVELGVVIGKAAKHVSVCDAMEYVGGYCVALDMTATCQIKTARQNGQSWTIAKGFDTACPVSKFIPKSCISDPGNVELWCNVNGKCRQRGNTSDLVFNVPFLVSYLSKYMTLEPNDLIVTGSPPGMGPVFPGDVIEGGIKNIAEFKFKVEHDK